MCRDRVGAKSIHHQKIKLTIGYSFQLQPAITDYHPAICPAVIEESEEPARDRFDVGIDFKKGNRSRGTSIGGHASSTQAEDPYLLALLLIEDRDHITNRS